MPSDTSCDFRNGQDISSVGFITANRWWLFVGIEEKNSVPRIKVESTRYSSVPRQLLSVTVKTIRSYSKLSVNSYTGWPGSNSHSRDSSATGSYRPDTQILCWPHPFIVTPWVSTLIFTTSVDG